MRPESTDLDAHEDLSALADGEVDESIAARLSVSWRDDADLRSRWHAYHLIGDVLRSDDLAGSSRDATLWAAVRARIAEEPVVVAPAPSKTNGATGRSARRWIASGAVAAGFVAVAGALVVLGGPGGREPVAAPQLARAPEPIAATAATQLASASAPVAVADERATAANGALIRDARIERYLAAHQQFGGSSALGVPSGFLRNATYEAPNR
ncbi:sigma-E factor negative regulatory protein [Caldimonas sp. KR1-144]|uniref:sigma-E factor negative regulatory protein n=1 Tax=Caldimonas sp. KR1-144 TaxID=3400911 RepID=UPI003C0A0EF1